MTQENTMHLCPSQECARNGHYQGSTFPPVWTLFPASPTPAVPPSTGFFVTYEMLNGMLNEARKSERALVLFELSELARFAEEGNDL